MRTPRRLLFIVLLSATLPAVAQFTQQGPKLVGPLTFQGDSIALSADGNTALVGGTADISGVAGALVWTRSGGVWNQQGNKLVGSDAVVGSSVQVSSVAVSGDGNTAIVGGSGDNGGTGAAWIFARSGGIWTQQGSKLVGSGAVGTANQGISVSLSADGNTAIAGGFTDNNFAGAAWVWTRSGGVWTQQGSKLVASDAVGNAQQGRSVSVAADGNTAIVGGTSDNHIGAAWIWTRNAGVWSQQGTKLVGSGAVGGGQGHSVSISGDGNTAIAGSYQDHFNDGAAWVFTRSGGVWTQQGTKLVGSGASAGALQGYSVGISGDGNTAIVGAPFDSLIDIPFGFDFAGAAWVWTRSGGVWTQQGTKLVGSGTNGPTEQGHSVALSADGNTAIIGGPTYSSGAAWVFVTGAALIPAFSSFASLILLLSIALLALFRLK